MLRSSVQCAQGEPEAGHLREEGPLTGWTTVLTVTGDWTGQANQAGLQLADNSLTAEAGPVKEWRYVAGRVKDSQI